MAIIYQTFSLAEAQIKLHITQLSSQADLWIYAVSSRGMAYGDGLWYITNNRAEASSRVYFCPLAMADLIVYFTHHKLQAGWQHKHYLHNRL